MSLLLNVVMLNAVKMCVIMLSVIMLNEIMLIVIMLSVIDPNVFMLNFIIPERRYAECRGALLRTPISCHPSIRIPRML
jgi:hypothetical protein